jgi:penicillin amidase
MTRALTFLFALALLSGCSCGGPVETPDGSGSDGGGDAAYDDPPPPAALASVPQTERWVMPGISEDAFVVRTEMDVPHVYARSQTDALRVLGFIMARDRWFQMDLTRRLSQGRISELLGDVALGTDLENRMTGGAFITGLYTANLTPTEEAEMDAFADGINRYIEAVRSGDLNAPQELLLARGILGAATAADLMIPWTREDVISTGVSVLYGTSFEGGDVGHARSLAGIDALFTGFPSRDLRLAGLREDVMNRYAQPRLSSSAMGWGLDTAGMAPMPIVAPSPVRSVYLGVDLPETSMLDRLERHLMGIGARTPRGDEGYGSNSWAVMGSATTDGNALLAGDGHLQLSVPALFWQFGMDTVLIGGADGETTREIGATIAGLPAMGVGTNGRVAWSQTAFFADVTDWYTEELVLGADGLPMATRFEGADRPLTRVDETFEIADVPSLDSVGRTETIPRFVTFDGRWLSTIEGRPYAPGDVLAPGEAALNVMGDMIVPGDVDGDGVIDAVSFFYGPFDGGTLLRAFRNFADSDTVEDFRQATRTFIGYGGAMTAADRDGGVVHTAYHAVPCRGYLTRDASNVWVEGADPRRLLDGTRFGAWHIPLEADGSVDEAAAAAGGPTACAVPADMWPEAQSPTRQYVHHANNDPGNITSDDDLFDDPYYIGGPWIEGYRASRIEQRLQAAIAGHTATFEEMQDIQADHHSNLGDDFLPVLLDAIDAARTAAAGSPATGTPEARMAASWTAHQADYEEVERRVLAWQAAGMPTPSGVETFYSTPAAGDAENSVATTVFHTWLTSFVRGVMDDEQIPGDLFTGPTGDTNTTRLLRLIVLGRGPGNPSALASYDPTTEESVYFDDATTTPVESSEELAILAIDRALTHLRSAPTAEGNGGYGSTDFTAYVWGLRHMVRFDSLVGDALGATDDPTLGVLLNMFTITPRTNPLGMGLPAGDPRLSLPHFPRPGDHLEIDAGNPGFDLDDWTHGSGPVFRMVVSLGPAGVRGETILPGGQSGRPSDDHFDDQARLWLANETIPMRFTPEEVVAGATGMERFAPPGR